MASISPDKNPPTNNQPQNSGIELYFKARTYSKLKNKSSALAYLAQAIQLSVEVRKKAKEDPDFSWLWRDPDFQDLTK